MKDQQYNVLMNEKVQQMLQQQYCQMMENFMEVISGKDHIIEKLNDNLQTANVIIDHKSEQIKDFLARQ